MELVKWFIRGFDTVLPYLRWIGCVLFFGFFLFVFGLAFYEAPTPLKIFWGVAITVLALFFGGCMVAMYWEDIVEWAKEK